MVNEFGAIDTLVRHIHQLEVEGIGVDYIVLSNNYADRIREEVRTPRKFKDAGNIYLKKYDVLPISDNYQLYYKREQVGTGK